MRKNSICLWVIGIALVIGVVLAGCGTGPALPASPEPPEPPEPPASSDFDTEAAGDDVIITGYRGEGGDVIIPAFINGKRVIGIGMKSFVITRGNAHAFWGRASLTSVTIPNSIVSIDGRAFRGCSGLSAISVAPTSEQYTDIDGVLFTKDGKTLHTYPAGKGTAYTIPFGVTAIGGYDGYAFSSCSGLTSVTIPDSVTSIGDRAFAWCSGLTSVTIPASVTSIGWGTFSGCSGLTSVTIPDSVTSIGEYAFSGCSGLSSVTIPDGVTAIDKGAFSGCSSLISVTIPADVTSIGAAAFANCSSLTAITIPDGVISIGVEAFYGCASLTAITIPASVTRIGERVFTYCKSLNQIDRETILTRFGERVFWSLL
jgi:hypothetical protein